MSRKASGVIAGTSNGAEDTQSYKSFIAKKMAERRAEQGGRGDRSRFENKPGGPRGNVGRDGTGRPGFSFGERDNINSVKSESTENKGNSEKKERLRQKKEAILANARKKMGINEEKRNEFKLRSIASQEKRRRKRQRMRRMRQESGAQ